MILCIDDAYLNEYIDGAKIGAQTIDEKAVLRNNLF